MQKNRRLDNYVAELEPAKFRYFVRMINKMTPEGAKGVANGTLEHLTRLGLQRDPSKGNPEVYAGAINTDVRSLLDWAASVQAEHPRAQKQLIALDATAFNRSGG